MESDTTLGDPWPRPGMGAFQIIFFVSSHSRGAGCSPACPLRSGPRHQGQSVSESGKDPAPGASSDAKAEIEERASIRIEKGSLCMMGW